eukprot:7772933-Pyramimonas_sp.AAC.1
MAQCFKRHAAASGAFLPSQLEADRTMHSRASNCSRSLARSYACVALLPDTQRAFLVPASLRPKGLRA